MLFSKGGDLFCRDILGKTPIDYAKESGHNDAVALIIKYKRQTILAETPLSDLDNFGGIDEQNIAEKMDSFMNLPERGVVVQVIKVGILLDKAKYYLGNIHTEEKVTKILFWAAGNNPQYNAARTSAISTISNIVTSYLNVDATAPPMDIVSQIDQMHHEILSIFEQYEKNICVAKKGKHFNVYSAWKSENEVLFTQEACDLNLSGTAHDQQNTGKERLSNRSS